MWKSDWPSKTRIVTFISQIVSDWIHPLFMSKAVYYVFLYTKFYVKMIMSFCQIQVQIP